MTPRWSVMATMADSSSANLRSASSFDERRSASSASKGRRPPPAASSSFAVSRTVGSLIMCAEVSGGRAVRGLVPGGEALYFLEAVAQLVARDAEQLGGARLVAAAALDGLPHQPTLHLFERDASGGQRERPAVSGRACCRRLWRGGRPGGE